jgi:hypothetical protein
MKAVIVTENNIDIVSIHYQNKDLVLKDLADNHSNIFFKILNIGDNNFSFIQTPSEIATIESFHNLPDKLYLLNNNVILDLEFDSSGKSKDLTRYMLYSALISYKFTVKSKYTIFYPVRTVIVYPGNVKLPPNIYTKTGSLLYSVEQISLNDVINGDEFLDQINREFAVNPNLVLSEEDVVKLTVIPGFFHTTAFGTPMEWFFGYVTSPEANLGLQNRIPKDLNSFNKF